MDANDEQHRDETFFNYDHMAIQYRVLHRKYKGLSKIHIELS